MIAIQTECSRLEQRSDVKSLSPEKCNHMKFIEECAMCTETHVLVKKCLYME